MYHYGGSIGALAKGNAGILLQGIFIRHPMKLFEGLGTLRLSNAYLFV